MQGKNVFLEDLVIKIDSIIFAIEDRETMDDDLSIVRELAEQLKDEVESLQE